MVKFGKKFFFDAKYEKKAKRRLIIGGILLLIILVILIIVIASVSKKKKTEPPKKVNDDILLRQEIVTSVKEKLPDKTSYFEKLANIDLDKITITYPENMEISINAEACPVETLDTINNILDGTSEGNLDDYECIKYVPAKTGEYDVNINLNDKDYTVKLLVKDITAPTLTLKNIEITSGDTYAVEDFVESCKDNYDDKCYISYYYNSYDNDENKLDYSSYITEGSYDVKIIASDNSGNVSLPLTATIVVLPKAPNKYLVTFDTNGGTSINGEYIEEGKTITKPANPTKNGYTFKQWTLNGETYDFATPITSEITLVAEWTKNETKPAVTPITPGCTYGNKTYDTNKYILSVYANTNSNCATSTSEFHTLRDGPLTTNIIAKDFNRIQQLYSGQYIPYVYGPEVEGVFNTSNNGLVGYQITVYIRKESDNTIVAIYKIDTQGKRHFTLNTINLPQ